ncbi:MAG: 50S ribosomal protein L20 [Pseudomonadota bacterium]
MPRVRRGNKRKNRRKKILKMAKGYRGGRSKLFRTASEAVDRALNYAYRDRRTRKREFRRLWVTRINAAARLNGTTYSRLIQGLKNAKVIIDRKILAELAVSDPTGFSKIVNLTKGNS